MKSYSNSIEMHWKMWLGKVRQLKTRELIGSISLGPRPYTGFFYVFPRKINFF